jgi:hypothetical protein
MLFFYFLCELKVIGEQFQQVKLFIIVLQLLLVVMVELKLVMNLVVKDIMDLYVRYVEMVKNYNSYHIIYLICICISHIISFINVLCNDASSPFPAIF